MQLLLLFVLKMLTTINENTYLFDTKGHTKILKTAILN